MTQSSTARRARVPERCADGGALNVSAPRTSEDAFRSSCLIAEPRRRNVTGARPRSPPRLSPPPSHRKEAEPDLLARRTRPAAPRAQPARRRGRARHVASSLPAPRPAAPPVHLLGPAPALPGRRARALDQGARLAQRRAAVEDVAHVRKRHQDPISRRVRPAPAALRDRRRPPVQLQAKLLRRRLGPRAEATR